MESQIETRTLKSDKGSEFQFPFLVVDAPEKWPEAKSFSCVKTIPNTRISVKINGVSYTEFERIQAEHIIPDQPEPTANGYEQLKLAREDAILAKEIAILEASTGNKIPGETTDEKVAFVKSKGKSDVQGLIAYVQDFGCCWNDGNDQSSLINQYRSLLDEQCQAVTESPFAEWSDAKDAQYSFIIQRPHDDFITEFRLRGISSERDFEIRKATDPGNPESIPYKDPTTNRIVGVRPNMKDPKWLAKANRLAKKALLMYIEATMPFPVPGTNDLERAEWIGKRLIGDVAAVKAFIDGNITSYGASLSFF